MEEIKVSIYNKYISTNINIRLDLRKKCINKMIYTCTHLKKITIKITKTTTRNPIIEITIITIMEIAVSSSGS